MLSKAYSYAHKKMSIDDKCGKFHDGITNGAAWYILKVVCKIGRMFIHQIWK